MAAESVVAMRTMNPAFLDILIKAALNVIDMREVFGRERRDNNK